jgi:hypothetical protein
MNKKILSGAALGVLLLNSCGQLDGLTDDAGTSSEVGAISSSSEEPNVFMGAKVVDRESSLPECRTSTQGQLFYIQENEEFVWCNERRYEVIDLRGQDGRDGSSCTARRIPLGTELICDGEIIDTLVSVTPNQDVVGVPFVAQLFVSEYIPGMRVVMTVEGVEGQYPLYQLDGTQFSGVASLPFSNEATLASFTAYGADGAVIGFQQASINIAAGTTSWGIIIDLNAALHPDQCSGDIVWEAGMGAQVMMGGYWYGQVDEYGSTWGCAGENWDYNDRWADATPCDDGQNFSSHLTVNAGTLQDDFWGWSEVGFNFLDDGGAHMFPYSDLATYPGICVEYTTTANLRLRASGVNDLNADSYGVMLPRNSSKMRIPWSSFRQEGWSGESWTFNPADVHSLHFQLKEAEQNNASGEDIQIRRITLDYGIPYSSSSTIPSSSSITPPSGNSELIWAAGMGAQTMMGGYWFGFADSFGSTWGCAGENYDGSESGVDTSPCDNGSAFQTHLTVHAGTLQDMDWGFAGVGLNLLDDGGAWVPPAYHDAAAFEGLCINYRSYAAIRLSTITTSDLNDDTFGTMLLSGDRTVFVPWREMRQEGWSGETWTFSPADLNRLFFMQKEADQISSYGNDLSIRSIGFSDEGACPEISEPIYLGQL